MARLPDIPHDLWIEDQQQQFQRRVGGLLQADEFDSAISEFNATNIPTDWPVPGGIDNEEEEQRLLEEQRRQAEEAAARQEEYDRLYASQWDEYQRQLQEQDVLVQQAQAEASAAGIPSPDDFLGSANRLANQPGWNTPDDDSSPVLAQSFLDGSEALTDSLGIPSPEQFMSSISDIGSSISSGLSSAASTIQDKWNSDMAYQPTPEDQAANPPFWESGLGKDVSQVGSAVQGAADAAGGYLGAAANIASTPIGGQFGDAALDMIERAPIIGGPVAGARRALDTAADVLSTPETPEQIAATGKAQREILRAPLQFIGSIVDILAGDPRQEIRHKDPWGIMDSLGVEEGITKGDIIANVAPVKILNMPQWLDVGAQLVDNPGETTVGLAAIGGLGRLLGMGPWGQRAALSIIGGIAGGIDSAISQRDIVGGDGSGYTASDLAAETAAGAALGLGGAVGAQKGLPAVARLIKTIAGSETMAEAIGYIDQLATKVVDDVASSISPKYPAVGEALRLNPSPSGWESVPALGRGEQYAQEIAPKRAIPGGVTGATTGAITGFASADEDATLQERLGRAATGGLVGTPLGRFAATEGTIAGGKLIDSLIKRGALDASIFDSHPPTADRIRALFLMQAGDKADDAVVEVPHLASYFNRANESVRAQVAPLFEPGVTAGQVRSLVRTPSVLEATAQAATEFVTDAMLGLQNRAIRQRELGADAVTVNGLPQSMRYAILKDAARVRADRGAVGTVLGPAFKTQNPDVINFVKQASDDLGIPTPNVYIIDSPVANAAMHLSDTSKPGIAISKGLLDAGLTEDEMLALFKHELGHWGQRSQRTAYVVPPQVVDQMTSIPVRANYDDVERLAIEQAGGLIDETGVSLKVTRAQSKGGAGQSAPRQGVFYEVGDKSGYYTPNAGDAAPTGGSELIPGTETKFRNPLIIYSEFGDTRHLDDAFMKLDVGDPNAQQRWVLRYGDQGESFDTFATQGEAQARADRLNSAQRMPGDEEVVVAPYQPKTLTHDDIERELASIWHAADDGFGRGEEARQYKIAGIRQMLEKYGGTPESAEDIVKVRAEGRYPAFIVAENIIATNGRRQGYDAFINVDVGGVDPNDIYAGGQPRIAEIMSFQEGRNPVPAPPNPVKQAAAVIREEGRDFRGQDVERYYQFIRDTGKNPGVYTDEDVILANDYAKKLVDQLNERQMNEADEIYRLTRDAQMNPQGRPGYSVHPDIPLPEGTPRQTFESPGTTKSVDDNRIAIRALQREINQAKMAMHADPGNPALAERVDTMLAEYGRLVSPESYEPASARWIPELNPRDTETRFPTTPIKTPWEQLMDWSEELKGEGVGKLADDIATPDEWAAWTKKQADESDIAPYSPNLAGGLAGAGAASESLDPDEDDWRTSIGTLAGGALFGGAVLRRGQLGKVNFGPNDPKTQMFQKGPVRDALTNPTIFESARNFWTEKMTDQLSRLQGYQNDIAREFLKQTGKLIPAASLAAELKRMDPNRQAEMLVDRHMKPALLTLQRLGFDEDTLDSFLAYTHDLDVAKHIANYDNTGLIDDTRIFPGGTNGVDADTYLAKFYSDLHSKYTPDQVREFGQAVDQIWKLGDENLKLLRDAGLVKPETYTELRKIYPHYIPTNILAYISDDANVSVGKSLSVASNTVHALSREGTEKSAMGSVAALLSSTYEATAAANRNKVFNAFLGMWSNAAHLDQNIPPRTTTTTRTTPTGTSTITTQNDLPRSRERVHEFANLIRPKFGSKATQSGEWVPLQGFINGQKIQMEVHQDLGDVTKYESVPSVPIMSGLAAAFRAGATSRNPVFLTANAFLDWYTYMVRETARGGGGPMAVMNALGAYGEALGALLLTPQAWKDIASHEYSGDVRQALSEGMGYSGLTPGGQYTAESLANRVSQDPFQKKLGELLTWMGYEPKSAAEQEVQRLRRDIGLTTGAGSLGGAVAGGVAGHASAPENATPGDRFARTAGGAAAGFLAGGVAAGRIEARSAADIARVMKDLALLKPVEAVGERIELVPRVAARQLARNRHQDTILDLAKERAQALANPSGSRPIDLIERELRGAQQRQTIEGTTAGRTTTIDFNKGGTWAKGINSVIPFFNVGMQALADGFRAWDEKGWVYGGTLLNAAVMPAVFAEVLNHRDEETIADYNDVPQYMKDQGVIFMLPKQAFPPVEDERGNLHPQFLHLRYRQLAPLAIMTRKLMQDTIFQPDNMKDPTWAETVGSMLLSQSPLQATNPADAALGMATPALGTAVQLAFGRDTFRNRNIVSERADKQASPLSQALAERFGFDDEYTKHPSTWDFLTRDLFSGYANAWHGASEILYGKQKPYARQDVPVVGGLYGRFVKGSIGEEANRASEDLLTPSALEILQREKINWRPDATAPDIRGLPLTRREQGIFQQRINEEIDKMVHELPTRELWPELSVLEKKRALENDAEKRRNLVRGEILELVRARIGDDGIMQRVQKRVDEGEILPPGRR